MRVHFAVSPRRRICRDRSWIRLVWRPCTILSLITVGLPLTSCKPPAPHFSMPAPPPGLAIPSAKMSTSKQDLANYATSWQKATADYAAGNGKNAVTDLTNAATLRSTLLSDLQVDSRNIAYAIGEACWSLKMPHCAWSQFTAINATVNGTPLARPLALPLYNYHFEYGTRLAHSMWNYLFLGDAQCHANEAVTFANTIGDRSLAYSSNFLLASIYNDQGRRGLACRTYQTAQSYGTTAQVAEATASQKDMGCTSTDYSMFGDPFDYLQKDQSHCTEPDNRHTPHLSHGAIGTMDPDLYGDAIHSLQHGAPAAAWKTLSLLSEQAALTQLILGRDEHASQLALANADVLDGDDESAASLYGQWLKGETVADPTHPSTEVQQVSKVLAILDASLSFKYYQRAVTDQGKNNWQQSITEFGEADSYWQHPEDELGIAISELHLYTGCSLVEVGPTPLEQSYSAFQEYLERAPDAADRAQVQATMQAVKARETYCSSGQQMIDKLVNFIAADLIGYINHVNAALQAQVLSASSIDSMWNPQGNGFVLQFGGPSGNPDAPGPNTGATPPNPDLPVSGGGAGVPGDTPITTSTSVGAPSTFTVALPNVSMSPVPIPSFPSSSVSTGSSPAPTGGTVSANVGSDLLIPIQLPTALLNQATWSWPQGSYSACEGIGVNGSYRVNVQAAAQAGANGSRQITSIALWLTSQSFTQATPVVTAQVQVLNGTAIVQSVNLTRPDVPSVEAAAGPDESERLYLPTSVTLSVPAGGLLHFSVFLSLRQEAGACTSFSSSVNVNPVDGSIH